MRGTRIIFLIACCLLVLQCTGRQEGMQQPIEFYLDQDFAQTTKSSLVLEPTPIFPEGEQVDTLWIAAVARDMKTDDHLTKGVPYSSATGFPTDKNLGVIAYTYDSEGASFSLWELYTEEDDSWPLRYSVETGRWLPTPDLYYPSVEGYVRFFAFGPREENLTDENVTGISAEKHSAPALSYTVPSAIEDQRGLLVASPEPRQYPYRLQDLSVPLRLEHVLSGVRFAVDYLHNLISVTVSGVYDQGKYYMASESWGEHRKSIVVNPGPSYFIGPFNPASSSYYESDMERVSSILYRVASKYTLMMIPQYLPDGAKITVQLEGEASPRVLNVSGQLWEKGKIVTYLIAYDRISLSAMVPDNLIWDTSD